ncbi:MAG: hypothetical protein A2579_02795 [Lysobacterales bacterium RIFOXYD1_FULL_69_11]|nr:MAG: hypothetical protein A2579_02795 [Xanthomonadales bacterium RIFOXYD1_FULL_69_11]
MISGSHGAELIMPSFFCTLRNTIRGCMFKPAFRFNMRHIFFFPISHGNDALRSSHENRIKIFSFQF